MDTPRTWFPGLFVAVTVTLCSLVRAAAAESPAASVLLSNADGRSPFSGVARYEGRATCSAALIATVDPDREPDAPAYVLTSGHCPGFPGTGEVIVNVQASGRNRVIFEFFADTVARQHAVNVRTVSYMTMKGRDLAVLELDARLSDLVRRGLVPLFLGTRVAEPDEALAIVGAPLRTSPSTSFLRMATCQADGFAETVFEYIWSWFDLQRNNCLDVAPGSSGSAVVSRVTGRLLAILGTTTAGAAEWTDCFLDHPCEPADAGGVGRPATSYAMPVYGIDACFRADGEFAVGAPGCILDPGAQNTLSPTYLGAVNPAGTGRARPRTTWGVRVTGALPYYRYKVVRPNRDDCRTTQGYSRPLRVLDHPVIDDPLPGRDGFYLLCVIAGERSLWGGWQRPPFASFTTVRIDTLPPRIPDRVTLETAANGWRLTFGTLPPEVAGHAFKVGRVGETRCDDPSGYRDALVPFFSITREAFAQALCVMPFDAAGNDGPPRTIILP